MKKLLFIPILMLCLSSYGKQKLPFQNSSLPIEQRVDDLVSRLTLEEKVKQMMNGAPAIERLEIPAYNWWNECLHGVGRSGDKVTVFPQAIALAATFDAEGLRRSAEIISDEARAIYNQNIKDGNAGAQYKGLTFWTPNINIFRDPRWGRGQETYGEDPYLTAIMGSAMVRGLQGDDPQKLKVSACAKHYAVHSGPESNRHSFDITVSKHDLWDTYMPAFRELVLGANVSSVMCAYNRYQGQPCCGSDLLMRAVLINNWKFKGYVTSDCGAVEDFYANHKTHPDSYTAVADAVLHGTDLDCGGDYGKLYDAVQKGLITEEQIDISLKRLFRTRFLLGMFDEIGSSKYDAIPYSILESKSHGEQALKMSRKSMVLLENNGILPLSSKKRKIALIGPNADNGETQLGNYNGFPTKNVTILDALKAEPNVEVVYHKGTELASVIKGVDFDKIVSDCKGVDLIIFAGGISPRLEGEEGDAGKDMIEGFTDGDRSSMNIPSVQIELLKKLKTLKKPIIFVSMSGSAISFDYEKDNCDAILQAWYGGQATGTAVTDILFGRYNPSGRLPVTFYKSDKDLPDFEDYSMKGRTYRYFNGKVLYPFGYGLSYTTYKYSGLSINKQISTHDDMKVTVQVKNGGKKDGQEVVQLYISNRDNAEEAAICELKGIRRVDLKAGETKTVEFIIPSRALAFVTNDGVLNRTAGNIKVFIGGRNPNADALQFGNNVVETSVNVIGERVLFDL